MLGEIVCLGAGVLYRKSILFSCRVVTRHEIIRALEPPLPPLLKEQHVLMIAAGQTAGASFPSDKHWANCIHPINRGFQSTQWSDSMSQV